MDRFATGGLRAAVIAVATATAVAGLTGSTGAAVSPAVRLPPANGQFDYQIGGAYSPSPSVQIVDRDRTSHPAPGAYNVCYINAFQTQAEDATWWRQHHPRLLLHDPNDKLIEDPGWPGEYLLNTATAHSRAGLAAIEGRWLDGCRTKGFDAVEPDNLDSNTRSHHLLTTADNLRFAKLLVTHAHADGLAIAQKNSAEQSKQGATLGFDFAIAEECQVYNECDHYLKAYGDEVYEIEYTDNPRRFYDKACAARGNDIAVILRDRDVTPRSSPHYRYDAC